jgi:hypothetical protein
VKTETKPGSVCGDVVVKNPDSEILRKMYVVAQSLSAKVKGDEWEVYRRDGDQA